jgi:hypothetical protein
LTRHCPHKTNRRLPCGFPETHSHIRQIFVDSHTLL